MDGSKLSRIENNKPVNLTLKTIERLAVALKVPVRELFTEPRPEQGGGRESGASASGGEGLADSLRRAIADVLRTAIDRGGTTLVDYRDPSGRSGRMRGELRVYGREGEPCRRCRTPIEKTRVAGRGTWLCPGCQEAP